MVNPYPVGTEFYYIWLSIFVLPKVRMRRTASDRVSVLDNDKITDRGIR